LIKVGINNTGDSFSRSHDGAGGRNPKEKAKMKKPSCSSRRNPEGFAVFPRTLSVEELG
jgi:hypothetical protein